MTAIDEKKGDLTAMDISGEINLDGQKSSFRATMSTGTVAGAPMPLHGSPMMEAGGMKSMALAGMSKLSLSEGVIGKRPVGGGVDDKKIVDTVVTFHFVSNVPGRK